MAVTSVKEIGNNRTGQHGSQRDDREYDRCYRVRTDDPHDDQVVVLSDPGVPQPWDFFPSDPDALVVSRVCRQPDGDDANVWEVVAHYSYHNPLNEPWEIEWDTEPYKQAVTKDRDDEPIENSADDQYIPPPEVDDSRFGLTITRNQAAFDPVFYAEYTRKGGALNDDLWWDFPAETVRCVRVRARWQTENPGATYYKVTYQFAMDLDGWRLELLDAGFRRRFTALGAGGLVTKHAQITDGRGNLPSTPIPLDGAGDVLAEGDPPVYREFDIYPMMDFDALLLSKPAGA